MKNIKILTFASLALLATLAPIKNTYAAVRSISNVGLHINQDISVGDYQDDINVNIGNSNDKGINVYTNNDTKYIISNASLVKTNNRALKIGDEVKIKISLSPLATDNDEYKFNSNYNKSNVSITGGEYVSSNKRDGDLILTIKLKGLKGRLETPDNASWGNRLGMATWDAPNNSTGYSDIVLKKGDTEVTSIRDYKGSTINLYPYMTNKGRYTFKVRTVAYTSEQKKYGSNSEYISSDDLYIDADEVSDGRGRCENTDYNSMGPGQNMPSTVTGINNDKVGWIKENNAWYYKYPNGSVKTNGWEFINNKWYLFDNIGRMLTGWQQRNGSYYFLNIPDGDMKTGWFKDKDIWYYLNPTGDNAGAVLMNTWLVSADGKKYYLGNNGVMLTGWNNIDGRWYYFYPNQGHLATNTRIDTFYVDANGVWNK